MSSHRKHSLKKSVHRALLVRLSAAGLIIALIFGLAVFYIEINKVSDAAVARAVQLSEIFVERNRALFDVPGLPDHEAIQKELRAFALERVRPMAGHFVMAGIYNPDGSAIAEVIDREYPGIGAVKSLIEASVPRNRDAVYEIKRINGLAHIKTVTPLTSSSGGLAGFTVGIFVPSKDTVKEIRGRAVRTMLSVIAIVLITTALLYPIIINLTNKLSGLSVRLLDSNLETLQTLGSAIAMRDSDTNAHNFRVTIISVRIAEAAGLSFQAIQTLIKGAFLHDVGKIGIKDSILLKPGRLTEEEFSEMKKHVSYGHEIVKRSAWLHDSLDVVSYHHEKIDGHGYLDEIKDKEIPVTARIFAIADVFDALTSRRPYKEPFPFEKAMDILEQGRGSHFDPDLLDAFKGIAGPLYDNLSGRDDEPSEELEEIVHKYFREGIEGLNI